VHESLIERTDSYCYTPGPLGGDSLADNKTVATKAASKQGVLHFVPGLKTPIDVVHHGFDSENWPLSDANDPDVLITVGFDLHTDRIRNLKGIDMILAVAPAFPDRRFVLVGFDQDAGPTIPPNVEVYGRVRRDELIRHYQRAGYYMQLSLSEGFGCALAEAMLCGCIPVVSRAGAPPFIIGRHGAIAETRTVDHVVSVLTDLFRRYDPENHREARAHIEAEFPLERRVAGLSRLLGS
jgi:glycosyltransferase involved in cell wall biosynthesis